jgi:hypothetical protein
MLRNLCLLLLITFVAGCGTGGGYSCSPEQRAIAKIVVLKEGGDGTEELSEMDASCKTANGMATSGRGVRNAAGDTIIKPGEFRSWKMISNQRAIVETFKDNYGTYRIFTAGKGVSDPLPWDMILPLELYTSVRNSAPTVYFGIKKIEQKDSSYKDIALFSAFSKEPRILKNLGGPGIIGASTMAGQYDSKQVGYRLIRRYGNSLYISFTDENGIAASQILNLGGDVVSNKMGVIQSFVNHTSKIPPQVTTKIANFKVPDFPSHFGLVWPVKNDGELMRLPPGAIGVYPLLDNKDALYGWLIFYLGQSGLEFEAHKGSIETIPVNSAGVRYIGYNYLYRPDRNRHAFSAVKNKAGKWILFDDTMAKDGSSYLEGQSYTTVPELKAKLENKLAIDKAADKAKWAALFAEQDRKQALERRQTAINNIGKSRDICSVFSDVLVAGIPYVDTYAEKCPIYGDEMAMKLVSAGATSTKLTEKVKTFYKQQFEYEQRVKDAERIKASYQPIGTWENGPLNIANPGTPSAQQQRYQMERQLNKQIFNKPWDPYK